MSFEKRREIVSFLMRAMVGAVLIYSGYIKISEPLESFISSILSYKVVGEKTAYYAASILPWAEVYIGVLLILGLFTKWITRAAFLLFCFFEILLLQAMARGLEVIDCGCFGAKHSNPIGVEFGLNLIWIFFIFMAYKYSYRFSFDKFIEKKYNSDEK